MITRKHRSIKHPPGWARSHSPAWRSCLPRGIVEPPLGHLLQRPRLVCPATRTLQRTCYSGQGLHHRTQTLSRLESGSGRIRDIIITASIDIMTRISDSNPSILFTNIYLWMECETKCFKGCL